MTERKNQSMKKKSNEICAKRQFTCYKERQSLQIIRFDHHECLFMQFQLISSTSHRHSMVRTGDKKPHNKYIVAYCHKIH